MTDADCILAYIEGGKYVLVRGGNIYISTNECWYIPTLIVHFAVAVGVAYLGPPFAPGFAGALVVEEP